MTPPRRVALVIGQLQMGGAERQLYELAVRLDRARWDPLVVCLSEVSEPFAGRLLERGVPVDLLKRSGHHDPLRALRLARLFASRKVDLVHSFLIAANAYVRAATWLGPPSVRRIPYIASSRTRIPPRGAWPMWAHRRAFRGAAAVVANSERVRDFTRDLYGLPDGAIRVIPNGIDMEPFAAAAALDRDALRRELGVPAGARVAGTLGRLSVEKNLPLFLEVAGRLAAPAGEPDAPPVFFVIAGGGPMMEDLRRRAAGSPAADRILFTGPRQDVARVLAAFDVFVLTSDTEGLPNAVMEAMASGLPVVATRAGGTEELVQDGVTGRLAPVGDGTALASLLGPLLADASSRKRLGEAGRRRIAGEFTAERMVERTAALYEEVIG